MKLSTLVFLFLLALFQVSAKPSLEFAEEEYEAEQFADEYESEQFADEYESEQFAEEMDTLQEEWNLEDLQFEEGELEDFLSEETEQKNPEKVLNQRTSIIKKILQLQQRLQSLVITPGNPLSSLGGGNNNQLLQLLLGGGNLGGSGSFNFGGSSKKQQKQLNKLLQQLYGGSNNLGSLYGNFGSFGGSSSKQYTKLLKQLTKGGNNNLNSLLQNPYILQNPQLLYYLILLQGGKGFKLPQYQIPKIPKVKAPKATGSQMCWCPCQQANAPSQTFNPNQGFFGGFGTTGLGFGTTGIPATGLGFGTTGFSDPTSGFGFGTTGLTTGFGSFPFGTTFEEVQNDETESQVAQESEEIVIPYPQ